MTDETREVATTEGHRGDLERLESRRDRSTTTDDRRHVEDAGVALVLTEEEQGRLRARHGLHVVPTALREQGEGTDRSRVATNSDVGGADHLAARVEGHPLTVDEGHSIGRLGQRRVGEREVTTVNRHDVRSGLEVDLAESRHERFLLLPMPLA